MDRIATYIGCFWLFVVLDSFFIWNSFEMIIKVFALVGVICATMALRRNYPSELDGKTFSIILCVGAFFLWMLFVYSGNIVGLIYHLLSMIALIAMLTWPVTIYERLYVLFRKIIILPLLYIKILKNIMIIKIPLS